MEIIKASLMAALQQSGGGGQPVIQSLTATENRTYTAPQGVDGYNPVTVAVPVPTLTTLTATENRTYTAPTGTAYNIVDVNVPTYEEEYEEMVECSQAVIAALQAYDPDFDPQGCEDIVPEVEKIGDENAAVTPMLDKTSYPDLSTADLPDNQGTVQVGGLTFTFYKYNPDVPPSVARTSIGVMVTAKGWQANGYITTGEIIQKADYLGVDVVFDFSEFVVAVDTNEWGLILNFKSTWTGTGTGTKQNSAVWTVPAGANSWHEFLGYNSKAEADADLNSAGVNVSTVK